MSFVQKLDWDSNCAGAARHTMHDQLKQILINLLTNALKFTKTETVREVSIRISVSKDRPTDDTSSVQFVSRATNALASTSDAVDDPVFLIFEVKDTGKGMNEKEKAQLFQRFVQANAKTHVHYGGFGLGLFICKRLTEMQGGAIGVASQPGHGSTFTFYIEARIPTEEAIQQVLAKSPPNAVKATLDSFDGISVARSPSNEVDICIEGVLVVEDNPVNQSVTQRGLVARDVKVEVANHGLDALEKLKRLTNRGNGTFPLSVITMDMEMPVMDGLECTRKIRELEKSGELKGPRIPIIAVSGNARDEQITEAKNAGCDDVLVKPYRIPELVEKMQVVVRRLGGLSPNSPLLG